PPPPPAFLLLTPFPASLVGAWRMREPVEVAPGAHFHLTPQRPSVPAVARRPFVLASLAVISSWSIAGLFLSLGPELSTLVYNSDTHLIGSIGIVMLALPAALSQIVLSHWAPWRAAAVGSLVMAVGMGLVVASAAADSAVLFTVGALVTGTGFGAAFLGGLRALSSAIPPEHRAATMSAFYLVAYGSLPSPAVIAGFLVEPLGVQETFEIFGSAIILVALLVTAEAWRQRSRTTVLARELATQPS